MMEISKYVDVIQPKVLNPEELDEFLARGWYRFGSKLFTTGFLNFNGNLYNAVWIRIPLDTFQLSKSQKKLLNKCGNFRVDIEPYKDTTEKSKLFSKYRETLSFNTARSIDNILSDTYGHSIFDTYNVCMYDGDKLIACGIFDLGYNSAEGIVSFYDPEYKKLSLGKVLILYKILYCHENGLEMFYPGYVTPGYKKFDYKLEISKETVEFLDIETEKWNSVSYLNTSNLPLQKMREALEKLEIKLKEIGFPEFDLRKYNYYDISLNFEYTQYNLLSHPIFIYCFPKSKLEEVIIVYDLHHRTYKLLICQILFNVKTDQQEMSYTGHLIKPSMIILESENIDVFVQKISKMLTRRVISI